MGALRVKVSGVWVDVPGGVGPTGPQGPIGPMGPGIEAISAANTTVLKGTIPQDGSPMRIHTNHGVASTDANGRFMLNTYFTKVLMAAYGVSIDNTNMLVTYDFNYNPGGADQCWWKVITPGTAGAGTPVASSPVRINCTMFGF